MTNFTIMKKIGLKGIEFTAVAESLPEYGRSLIVMHDDRNITIGVYFIGLSEIKKEPIFVSDKVGSDSEYYQDVTHWKYEE